VLRPRRHWNVVEDEAIRDVIVLIFIAFVLEFGKGFSLSRLPASSTRPGQKCRVSRV